MDMRSRIEGAVLVTFISLIRFRNQLVNKKRLNLLHSRRVTKRTPRVLQACAEACACGRTPLSNKPAFNNS